MTTGKPIDRRQAMLQALYGVSGVGLISLATGLPIPFLEGRMNVALGADDPTCGLEQAQYLVLSTSGDGDPITCNVPGTYVDGVTHPDGASMAETAIMLGAFKTSAAAPWAGLPQWALNRTSFMHHATLTVDHSDHAKVMRLLGKTLNNEMISSLFASNLASCLGTIQAEPIALGREQVSFQGRTLANMSPTSLKGVLVSPAGGLGELAKLRDKYLDSFNKTLKATGTKAQKDFLDRMALSQTQVRSINVNLIQSLSTINDDSAVNQLKAAMVLVQMKVSPVINVHIPFGGDNHGDPGLRNETAETISGLAALTGFLNGIKSAGLEDKITFGIYNVFGRSLREGPAGRQHSFTHNVTTLIGKAVKPGIVGGIAPDNTEFRALPIDSASGSGSAKGDIPYEETMYAMGKTMGAALGVSTELINENIMGGKIIKGALV